MSRGRTKNPCSYSTYSKQLAHSRYILYVLRSIFVAAAAVPAAPARSKSTIRLHLTFKRQESARQKTNEPGTFREKTTKDCRIYYTMPARTIFLEFEPPLLHRGTLLYSSTWNQTWAVFEVLKALLVRHASVSTCYCCCIYFIPGNVFCFYFALGY